MNLSDLLGHLINDGEGKKDNSSNMDTVANKLVIGTKSSSKKMDKVEYTQYKYKFDTDEDTFQFKQEYSSNEDEVNGNIIIEIKEVYDDSMSHIITDPAAGFMWKIMKIAEGMINSKDETSESKLHKLKGLREFNNLFFSYLINVYEKELNKMKKIEIHQVTPLEMAIRESRENEEEVNEDRKCDCMKCSPQASIPFREASIAKTDHCLKCGDDKISKGLYCDDCTMDHAAIASYKDNN